ncbi:MAG: type II/IV secretion system protein, partial [Deltaproteobacteria bacterium]|nr:type II/IV secretion system protein [Deltaproteobacteria bacterium]
GYHGRNGIFELLTITEGVRQLILKRSASDAIKNAAVAQGMRTLREDGWRKVREGSTTVAEVLRVTQDE